MPSIMLVEDDATMRSVLQTLLEIEGYTVTADLGQDGAQSIVSAVRVNQPDVILLDVHLRQESGLDVLKVIRADPNLSRIRVVMTSGMDRERECIQSGADAFLLKPYMPDELLSLIKV
jgi:CheY-like chemotaxis protein